MGEFIQPSIEWKKGDSKGMVVLTLHISDILLLRTALFSMKETRGTTAPYAITSDEKDRAEPLYKMVRTFIDGYLAKKRTVKS